ncbi:MAG: hypothetical protein IPK74_05165 [Deltaproteobacteria bacterium]|nr:hypothetical protein [Deltaproteobacteria bacterium]
MADATQRWCGWCGGVPQVGERKLVEHERSLLRARVIVQRRALRSSRIAVRAIGLSSCAAAVVFVAVNPHDQPTGLTIGAGLGVGLATFGILGGLYAAAAGRRRWVRWLFRITLVVPGLLALALSDRLPDQVSLAIMFAMSIGWIGGVFSVCSQWSLWRSLRTSFSVVDADLDEGLVLCFRGSPAAERPDDPGGASVEAMFEVLPRSRLLYSVQARPIDAWQPFELSLVAVPPSEVVDEWPTGDARRFQRGDANHTYRQRPLVPAECDELLRFRRRLRRQILVEAVVTAWGAAVLVRLVEMLLHWRVLPSVTRAGWLAVGILVGVRVWRGVTLARALARDQRGGHVLRIWSRAGRTIGDEPELEILPESGLIWTEQGRPASGRA